MTKKEFSITKDLGNLEIKDERITVNNKVAEARA
jgi:hypothetical protein